VDNQRFVARIGECEHDFLNFVFVKGSEVVRSLVKFKFCLSKSADPPNAEQGYEGCEKSFHRCVVEISVVICKCKI
jgi:hypothetical protein